MLEEYMAVCYLCAHFLLEEHLHELNIYSTGLVAFKIHCYLFLCMQVINKRTPIPLHPQLVPPRKHIHQPQDKAVSLARHSPKV